MIFDKIRRYFKDIADVIAPEEEKKEAPWSPTPRYPSPGGKLYGLSGEWTYCANGHKLGMLTRDVSLGDVPSTDNITLKHYMHFGVEECPVCGAKTMTNGGLFFMRSKYPAGE